MPPIGPIKRADLIRYLRQSGLTGPRIGTNHEYMQRGQLKVPIPNPHRGDSSVALLLRILRRAGISREEWERR